jgi:ParB family chromosome partitioning protein
MTRSPEIQLTPNKIGVKTISTNTLSPNPHNPRMLFDRAPLEVLRESIRKVGILVPLTVYWNEQRKQYIILDGQRRWICAQELGLIEVPVNQISEPSLVQNIVTMFQIHKLREDWELMPTALKLEVLMNALNDRNDKHLSLLCGLDQAVVIRCKKLLSYPKKYQDLMLDPDPDKRVKADFFIELYPILTDRLVKSLPWFHREKFTQRMLEKYQSPLGTIKSVTDFRIMKQHISNAKKVGRESLLEKRLQEFTMNDNIPISHLAIPSASIAAAVRRLQGAIDNLADELHSLDVDEFYGEEQVWVSLENLLKLIRQKLMAAGRRLKE